MLFIATWRVIANVEFALLSYCVITSVNYTFSLRIEQLVNKMSYHHLGRVGLLFVAMQDKLHHQEDFCYVAFAHEEGSLALKGSR